MLVQRESPIHGQGVFAKTAIPKGTKLGYYAGTRILRKRELRVYWKPGQPTYLWSLSNGSFIYGQSVHRYFNHSCEPNVEAAEVRVKNKLEIEFTALMDIPEGAELFIDYNLDLDEWEKPDYVCHCGTPSCRGTLIACSS